MNHFLPWLTCWYGNLNVQKRKRLGNIVKMQVKPYVSRSFFFTDIFSKDLTPKDKSIWADLNCFQAYRLVRYSGLQKITCNKFKFFIPHVQLALLIPKQHEVALSCLHLFCCRSFSLPPNKPFTVPSATNAPKVWMFCLFNFCVYIYIFTLLCCFAIQVFSPVGSASLNLNWILNISHCGC